MPDFERHSSSRDDRRGPRPSRDFRGGPRKPRRDFRNAAKERPPRENDDTQNQDTQNQADSPEPKPFRERREGGFRERREGGFRERREGGFRERREGGAEPRPDATAEGNAFKDTKPLPPAKARRIAVFGGTFDPIHNGHFLIAAEIIRRNLADEILFIPALIPPHKENQLISRPEDRLEMIRLAIADYMAANPKENQTVAQQKMSEFSYSDIELQRAGRKSYTIETMEILRKVYSDYDLCFVMGMDSLRLLPTWHKAAEFVTRTDFIVYPRPGVAPLPFLELEKHFGRGGAAKLLKAILPDYEVPISSLSSTAIRQKIQDGDEDELQGVLAPSVLQYIKEKHLYQNQGDSNGK